jgi:hypothetical protein
VGCRVVARKRRAVKVDPVKRLTSAIVLAAFILGAAPASTILVEQPVATATPMWAQEPPQPPQLSDDEQRAHDAKKAGKPYDPGLADSAQSKLDTAEKYQGKRNQQKQRGGPRRRR